MNGGYVMMYTLLEQIELPIPKVGICKKAQGLIEYALIILLVVIVIIAILGMLGVQVNGLFQNVVESFPES